MANYVYIATSIDGYIAAENDGLDWLNALPNPDNSDFGFADFMRGVDALVMGRRTFDIVQTFDVWPYNKPVFVLSNTLSTIPDSFSDRAEIVRGSPATVVAQLRERGFLHLYIDGGKTIQSFLVEDLIDEITITTIPVILGSGVPLFAPFGPGQHPAEGLNFAHVSTEVLGGAAAKTTYRRVRSIEPES